MSADELKYILKSRMSAGELKYCDSSCQLVSSEYKGEGLERPISRYIQHSHHTSRERVGGRRGGRSRGTGGARPGSGGIARHRGRGGGGRGPEPLTTSCPPTWSDCGETQSSIGC